MGVMKAGCWHRECLNYRPKSRLGCISTALPRNGGFYRTDGVLPKFPSKVLPMALNECFRQLTRAWVILDDPSVKKAYKSLSIMLIRALVSGNRCQGELFEA